MSLFFKPNGIQREDHSTVYVDLSRAASLANRRFYRQGLNWAVASIKVMSTTTDVSNKPIPQVSPLGRVVVSKAPTTWIGSNAWEKGFRHWQKQQKESGGVPGTFADFKVWLDESHFDQAGSLLPFALPTNGVLDNLGDSQATPGDWASSLMVIPRADANGQGYISDEYNIMFCGDNYPNGKGVVSLIQGYANSRSIGPAREQDPNTPAEMEDANTGQPENWLQAAFNDGLEQDSEVIENMRERNSQAPYPFEGYETSLGVPLVETMYPNGGKQMSGTMVHAIEPITGSTVGGTTYIQGGQFPCGLIRFDFFNDILDQGGSELYQQNYIQIDLVPGDHRGYLAESMVEM